MHDLKILTFPSQFLRKKARKIANVGDEERELLSRMAETMYLKGGVGLAATQVGIDKHLIVIDIGNGLIKLINADIIKKAGAETLEEGCLSVPELCIKVKRAKSVMVNYLDESGNAIQIKADGLLARAIQHELDHLCGKLIIDYLGPIKRILAGKRSKKERSKKQREAKNLTKSSRYDIVYTSK